jgi:hypothetical protein
LGPTQPLYTEKHIANVNRNGTLVPGIEDQIASHPFPVSVKDNAYQAAFPIYHGTPRIATGNVVVRQEIYG